MITASLSENRPADDMEVYESYFIVIQKVNNSYHNNRW